MLFVIINCAFYMIISVGSCYIIITFTKDIQAELATVNECNELKTTEVQFNKKFFKLFEFHSIAKQLSRDYIWPVKKSFVKKIFLKKISALDYWDMKWLETVCKPFGPTKSRLASCNSDDFGKRQSIQTSYVPNGASIKTIELVEEI